MGAFRKQLAQSAMARTPEQLGEVADQLSNWSYLHLQFMECEPTKIELEVMMYVELVHRNRQHILQRLYSRWQKAEREEHHKELGI